MDAEDLIDDEELVITMTGPGYIKAVAADAFRTQGRGGRGVPGPTCARRTWVNHIIHTTAHAHLLFFSNLGRVYRLRAYEIPMKERTARGTAIVNLLPLAQRRAHPGPHRHPRLPRPTGSCSSPPARGRSRRPPSPSTTSRRRDGFIAINLRDGDELVGVIPTAGATTSSWSAGRA